MKEIMGRIFCFVVVTAVLARGQDVYIPPPYRLVFGSQGDPNAVPLTLSQPNLVTASGSMSFKGIPWFDAKAFGAKGDTNVVTDAEISAGSNVVTSATANFSSADIGKAAEIRGAGAGGAVLVTWITNVLIPTQAALADNASTTVSNQEMTYGTDDTAALVAWAAAIQSLAVKYHAGLLPGGMYYLKQTLRFVINPGACNPALGINCGFQLYGNGFSTSMLRPATAGAFKWNVPSASVHQGVIYIQGGQGNRIQGIGVIGDNTRHDTSGNTGLVGGIVFTSSAHTLASDLLVMRLLNAGSNMPGMVVSGDLESTYHDIALENNDTNGVYSNLQKVTFQNVYHEAPARPGGRNVIWGGTTNDMVTWINVDFFQSGSTDLEISAGTTLTRCAFFRCQFRPNQNNSRSISIPDSAGTLNFYETDINLRCASNTNGIEVGLGSTVNYYGGSISGGGGINNPCGENGYATKVNGKLYAWGTTIAGTRQPLGASSAPFDFAPQGVGFRPGEITFDSLGTPADDGAIVYCKDCAMTNPCTKGSGALAKRLSGVWVCN